MKKIFNLVFALVLFSISANAAEVVTAWINNNYTQVPTNPGEKNRANSGTDYYVDLQNGGVQMILKNDAALNMPSSQFYKFKSDESTENGKPLSPAEVEACLRNGEYVYMTNDEIVAMTGSRPINYAIYETSGTIDVDDHYDGNETILVLTPKKYPGLYLPFVKNGCINYQGGFYYEPTGDDDSDYSLPPSGSEALTVDVDNSNENDIDINVPASETNEYGTYIENYYAGETMSSGGYEDYGYQPDPSIYWSLGMSWDPCTGWSFSGGLSNSPYGVGGGYNSGYGGYNSGYSCGGFNDYNNCGNGGGFNDYSTTNNYYGDYNSNNGDTYVNSFNRPIKHIVFNGGDDDDPPANDDDGLPTNTGGTTDISGDDGLPGNNGGTTTDSDDLPGGKKAKGFQKDYKKSTETGKEEYFAKAEDKKDEGAKTGNQSKSYDKVEGTEIRNDAPAKEQVKKQTTEKQFEKTTPKQQQSNKPAEKPFVKKPAEKQNEQPKPKVEQKKSTNVDENYDKPKVNHVEKKSAPEVKKTTPAVKKSAPVKKSSNTVKGAGAKNKPNSSVKKSSGPKYQTKPKKGNGQNYGNNGNRNRQNGSQNSGTRNNSGSSSKVKVKGR